MVSTSDSDSGNPSSIPGTTFFFCPLVTHLQPVTGAPEYFLDSCEDGSFRWLFLFFSSPWRAQTRGVSSQAATADKHAMSLNRVFIKTISLSYTLRFSSIVPSKSPKRIHGEFAIMPEQSPTSKQMFRKATASRHATSEL
jgi:hypothetical protein